MTAKEYVKKIYPNARAERHKSGNIKGIQTTYWLIRIGGNNMWFAEGKTESNAWVNAKKIAEKGKEKPIEDIILESRDQPTPGT